MGHGCLHGVCRRPYCVYDLWKEVMEINVARGSNLYIINIVLVAKLDPQNDLICSCEVFASRSW